MKDPRNDVVMSEYESGDLTIGRGSPDIAGLRVRHTNTDVIAQLSFHRLGPRAARDVDYEVYLNTDSDASEEYILIYGRSGNPRNGVYSANPAQTRKICDIESTFDTATDVVTFSATRRCLATPRTVKASAMLMAYTGPRGEEDNDYDYTDSTKRVPRA